MGDIELPLWLKSLPLAPEYRPTETEFADPLAFISKIEKEASTFGICKVIPPLPKPSKRFVFSNINRSLSKSPELGTDTNSGSFAPENVVFTTRHQELGSRRAKLAVHKQVWQSGEVYTLEQFEAKSKAFARTQLGHIKDVSPQIVEALFWKAAVEKPIYIEYANDVPGSGFGVPSEEPFRYYSHRQGRKRKFDRGVQNTIHGTVGKSHDDVSGLPDRQQKSSGSGSDREGTAGWKLSNSPWNLQVIARSPGSLTRFMPDEVPGVTSPMVYIGMLFSWFAWHVEDHELHSLNFLHTGSQKTWYAVPGSYASTMEDVVRVQGFGGNIDRLAAFTMLGEKTTLLSPEVVVASGIPCCRLVQNPGEFVVTFPRAYHVGFSHGFNCGEAANFATPEWLKVAKEAAVRRAAMNYLPMLSHQQLLYMLTMSFVSRVPRSFLPGVRSSRLRDRKKEEREILVRKAFLDDMMSEHHILNDLLGKESTLYAVLWHPDLLPSPSHGSQSHPLSVEECKKETVLYNVGDKKLFDCKDDRLVEDEVSGIVTEVAVNTIFPVESQKDEYFNGNSVDYVSDLDASDFSCGLDVDPGTLACVACGILGYPFMSIVQPSDRASKELLPTNCVVTNEKPSVSSCLSGALKESDSDAMADRKLENTDVYHETGASSSFNQVISQSTEDCSVISTDDTVQDYNMMPVGYESSLFSSVIKNTEFACERDTNIANSNQIHPSGGLKMSEATEKRSESSTLIEGFEVCHETGFFLEKPAAEEGGEDFIRTWNTTSGFLRPRIFCLQHALEIENLLQQKGGANVLIICHSDYVKIKGQAVSVAEEIGAHFTCMDVPMKTASQADLDLINKSIDNDEHEECGKDWTSKLGVNLRHCVKLRKQSSPKPEQLTLSLGGIFSDPIALSVVSSLKWQCRKCRTHQKTSSQSQSKLHDVADVNKDMLVVGKLLLGQLSEFQVTKNCEGEPNDISRTMKRRGRPRKKSPEVFDNRYDTVIADGEAHTGNDKSSSGCMNEELENNYTELANLPSVSILTPENSETRGSLATQEIITTSEVCASAKTNEFTLSTLSSIEKSKLVEIEAAVGPNAVGSNCVLGFDSSVIYQNMLSVEEPKMKSEIGGSVESVQPPTGLLLAGSYETHTKFRPLIKIYYKRKIRKSVKPGGESNTYVPKVVCSEVLQGAPAVSIVGQSDKSENQSTLSDSTNYSSELRQQIPATETTATGGIVLQYEGLTAPEILMVNGTEMQQEIQTALETSRETELEAMSSISRSSEECCKLQEVRMMDEESSMKTKFSNSLESAPTGITTSEGSDIHLAVSTAEEGNATCVSVGLVKDAVERDHGYPTIDDSKPHEKQRNKRKREVDQITSSQFGGIGFIRSPCEGLRPRSRCTTSYGRINGKASYGRINGKTSYGRVNGKASYGHVSRKIEVYKMRSDGSKDRRAKDKEKGLYTCDFSGCHMSFNMKGELFTHKRNRCTYEGCGKRFKCHEYLVRHQRVHTDERPLKCPWEGCNMSFKWAWARTEHVRVHTGERPYKCKVSGCGLTFRFVSDFSRHRRKTGHFVS